MSPINIQQNHRNHLKILQDQPDQVISDFCKLATNYLTKGSNIKLYQTASQKLRLTLSQVQSAVEGLVFLFIEATQNELNEESFREAVIALGLNDAAAETLRNEYLLYKSLLQDALPLSSVTYPHYENLEWRFETQVSSKSLRNGMIPRVLMKLDLTTGKSTESFCIQSDIPNVVHMSQMLNQALLESRSNHSRRIQRAVS